MAKQIFADFFFKVNVELVMTRNVQFDTRNGILYLYSLMNVSDGHLNEFHVGFYCWWL